jgi:hypothetical protein
VPFPVAAWVCGPSPAGIACSNPAENLDNCLLCAVRYRPLLRVDHSSRGVLVVCSSVFVKPWQLDGSGPVWAVAPGGGGGMFIVM